MNRGDRKQLMRFDTALSNFLDLLRYALAADPPDTKLALEMINTFQAQAGNGSWDTNFRWIPKTDDEVDQ